MRPQRGLRRPKGAQKIWEVQVSDWLQEIAKKKSSVVGLSRFVEDLIEDPHRFTPESVVSVLDQDDDISLYHPVRNSIKDRLIFKDYGNSVALLASSLMRNVFVSVVMGQTEDAVAKMAPDLRLLVFFYLRSEKERGGEGRKGGEGEKREEKGEGGDVVEGQVPIGHKNCS